jgi:dGTPase
MIWIKLNDTSNYACQEENSRERFFEEKQFNNNLSAFQRDRYRVIHSMAFRRLEYKTQVFMNYLGDHYRTRLTHSLEVSQVARVIAKQLDLNEDLADIIALSHDLGHPPFGHAGEEALARAAADFGGFDHNAQTLKIVLYLEKIYAEFDGLNLTWESIEGIAKHNGPVIAEAIRPWTLYMHSYRSDMI